MSLPKFTAEASLGDYGGSSHFSRKYKHVDGNSIRIEPQFNPSSCRPEVCYTQTCRYYCGDLQWCDGTQSVCEYYCCGEDPGTGYYECMEFTASTLCGPNPSGPVF